MTHHYVLTPADIADLRTSMRRMADGCGTAIPAPFIVWSPTDESYYLHAYGYTWCHHRRIEVVGAALRAERCERGWLSRAFDVADTPIEVLLGAEERAELRAKKREHEAHTKLALATRSDLAATDLEDFL